MSHFLRSLNPANGELLAEYPETVPEELESNLLTATTAFGSWRRRPIAERVRFAEHLAAMLRSESESLARLMTLEMGKPITQARAEIEKCAWLCDHYASEAEDLLAPQTIRTDARHSYVTFEPLGVVLGIMPWNFPFWQAIRFAVPTLIAGNGILLKHAPNVTGAALKIEQLMHAAEVPADLFRTLLLSNERTQSLVGHPAVSAVSLTGSTAAGRLVGAEAGRHLKPAVLELGGSDPYVILADADLPAAVKACATSRLINSGQSCIAAKRFVAVDQIHDRFETLFAEALGAAVMGDPLDEGTTLGPLARRDIRDNLHRQVTESVAKGARLVFGGGLPSGPGYFYPPTLLSGVRQGMPAFDEELFGPVAALVRAQDEADAIRLANASPYGLGAAVFTSDASRGESLAAHWIDAGSCFVNDYVRSDPRLPFGGTKNSGFGREMGEQGLRSFTNVKTVWVA